jgi:integrase
VYGGTKNEVREKLLRLQGAYLQGDAVEPSRMTVGAFLDHWLKTAAKASVRATTYTRYEGVVRLHIKPHIGGVPLQRLTPSQVQALYAELEGEGSARRHVHAVLHSALVQGVKWGHVVRNICDAVTKPRVTHREMQVLTAGQAAIFLKATANDRFHALWVLAISTGMRLGEMLALNWADVDLKAGNVAIRHTLIETSGKLVLGEPKTAKARRRVELPRIARSALLAHRKRMFAEGHAKEWVFCDTEGGPMRQSNLRFRSFEPIMRKVLKLGLPQIRIHDLRHTAATLMLQQGVHPKIVQEQLGHSQIGMTLDTYSHVLPSMQKAAAAKLDELFPNRVG